MSARSVSPVTRANFAAALEHDQRALVGSERLDHGPLFIEIDLERDGWA